MAPGFSPAMPRPLVAESAGLDPTVRGNIDMITESKIASLATHTRDARYWTPEQMVEDFLNRMRSGELGDVTRACIIFSTDEEFDRMGDKIAYYTAGTRNILELLGLLSMVSTAVTALTPAEREIPEGP